MSNTDDATDEILHELAEAKAWPTRLKQVLDGGSDVGDEMREAGERIEALEKDWLVHLQGQPQIMNPTDSR